MSGLPVADPTAVRRTGLALLTAHPAQLALALLVYAAAVATGLVSPYLVGQLVQRTSSGDDRIMPLTAAMLAALATQAVLLWLATRLTTNLAERVAAELREKFVTELLGTSLGRIEAVRAGDLVTRSTRDVNSLVQVASQSVPSVITTVLTILAILIATVSLGWYFLACLAVALPLLIPAARWYLRRSRTGYLAEQASYAESTEVLSENIRGARTVVGHGLETQRRDAMVEAADRNFRAGWYTLWLRSVFLPVTDIAIALPAVAILLFGGLAYLNGTGSIAAITTAALYAQQLSAQVDLFLYQQDKLQVGSAALARLLGLNSLHDDVDPVRAEIPATPHRLTLSRVSFAYRPGHDVLHDISLEISPGERIAIVGPSGAGKSTLARLIVGIDKPTHGRVRLNDIPLPDFPRDAVNRHLAMLTQHAFVFDGSIRDNLLIAAPDASEQQLVSVLDDVGAKPLVNTFGLDRPLTEADRGLNPAEQQQLSLARLVLTDPSTVVLDEATSQFDSRFARGLERALARLLVGRTVISIAHRLHSAEDADRVLVMQDGRIVADGGHAELLKQGGLYTSLWAAWRGEREEGT